MVCIIEVINGRDSQVKKSVAWIISEGLGDQILG